MKDELIQARINLGLTQTAVAELLGLSPQAIQKFERYDNDPKLSTLRRYANAVGVIVEHRVTPDVGQSVVMAGRSSWESGTQVRTVVHQALAPGYRQGAWSNRSSFAMAA
ncbi:MAG: helix-turn-helix transcriptional regulator [Nocardioides sp.]|jgi:DNA-binding XRE family transcriptional regulator